MHAYCMRDVERILKLSAAKVRTMIAHGFVRPTRGPGRAYRFSFQDLIVLRTARALQRADVPSRRIHRSLSRLRSQLPRGLPLTGLTVRAVGEQVLVHQGGASWLADSGQYVFEIAVSSNSSGQMNVVERTVPARKEAEEWFDRAVSLEETDPSAAQSAYRRVLTLDPCDVAAYVNLGRLLHDAREFQEAERLYRQALARCKPSGPLMFNLAVLLEDRGDLQGAMDGYVRAIESDPNYADAHFNLARLLELRGELRRAVRHLAAYRRLTKR
jgi:tetratricopeptide (TPR) repeat protein